MRLARIKCAIGRHRPSAVRATRFADGWISRCGHCRAPMAYLEETGWFLAQGADRNEAVAARRFAQVAALGLAMVPLQSSAAHNDGLFGNAAANIAAARPSLAEQFLSDFERSGLHCRSLIDGSNADAVRQVRALATHPETYKHVDTEVRAAANGRHSFVMVYTVDDAQGQESLKRSFGWIDTADCSARITHG